MQLKVNSIITSSWTKLCAVGNLQFRAAVTLNGISSFQWTADRILFKLKNLKLQTETDSGDGLCNVTSNAVDFSKYVICVRFIYFYFQSSYGFLK